MNFDDSPGIELPWRRSALSKCSCPICKLVLFFPNKSGYIFLALYIDLVFLKMHLRGIYLGLQNTNMQEAHFLGGIPAKAFSF